MQKISIFWFRRDLRLEDNAGLYHALKGPYPVLPLFIFDKNILDKLEDKDDARVTFIHRTLSQLHESLQKVDSQLLVKYGTPDAIWEELLTSYDIGAVYTNHDYEQYAIQRDKNIEQRLAEASIPFHTFKDHVIFERQEVTTQQGTPYKVFTPYSRQWLKKMQSQIDKNGVSFYLKAYPSLKYIQNCYTTTVPPMPSLAAMGFEISSLEIPPKVVPQKRIHDYKENRDTPSITGTSRLGIHFRFGTISIREKARRAQTLSSTFLNELIWRDFYAMVLANFPWVETQPFKEKYAALQWENNTEHFARWCEGKTGYPFVDAGMRELNATGFMHNRARMIVASFLTKHLLIDWRWGEKYFARKLLDFELASNNGGWQWAAGCGTDAAPYFRVFNPESQLKKFDKDLIYVKRWVPEYGTAQYPAPIVNHKEARTRCLARYKEALAQAE